MKIIDALNILSITLNEVLEKDVKEAYRKASKIYHPDINPAGLTMMQAVNDAYESLMKETFPITISSDETLSNYGEALNEALNSIITIQGLIIEICGAWIWVSGDTKSHKELLKNSKFLLILALHCGNF